MAFSAKYFKQELEGNVRSDVDLVIRLPQAQGVPEETAPAAKRPRRACSSRTAAAVVVTDPLQLAKFPAHNFILDTSEYFEVQQAASWQQQMPRSSSAAGSSSAAAAASCTRPTVHLTITSEEQLPAAEGVIAAMYGVPSAISSLEQQQQVHAVVLADMLDVKAASQQAVEALKAAAQSEHGLTAAALQVLADLPVWPDCLMQLLPAVVSHVPCCQVAAANLATIMAADPGGKVQRLLVAALGDLQAVWAAGDLQEMLLQLPLPAMQLLLSSNQLRVPSEDTVLYTAKQYVQKQRRTAGKAAAKAALAPLIRAPHLSQFALSFAVLPGGSAQQLLGPYMQPLKNLMMLMQRASAAAVAAELSAFEGAPASWKLGPRQLRPLADGVQLEWRLPVEHLKQACRDSFAQQGKATLFSLKSGPMAGLAGRMRMTCEQVGGGTRVGLFAGPAGMPAGSYIKFRCTITWHGKQYTVSSRCLKDGRMRGRQNYMNLPPMAGGGWDEAVWAAAGLPTTGDMLLQLHMHSIE